MIPSRKKLLEDWENSFSFSSKKYLVADIFIGISSKSSRMSKTNSEKTWEPCLPKTSMMVFLVTTWPESITTSMNFLSLDWSLARTLTTWNTALLAIISSLKRSPTSWVKRQALKNSSSSSRMILFKSSGGVKSTPWVTITAPTWDSWSKFFLLLISKMLLISLEKLKENLGPIELS